jgi:biotin carboxyl carrier protein
MIYYARVDGQDKKIRVEDKGDFYNVIIDDIVYRVDAKHLENSNAISLLVNSRCYEASITNTDRSALISISGEKFDIDLIDELSYLAVAPVSYHGHLDAEVIRTPMPGVVIAIEVRPGQRIDAGSPVAIVEAMKMQNEVSSILGGIVKEVLVHEGDTVETNQRLVTIERA